MVSVSSRPSLKAWKVFTATLATQVRCIVGFVKQESFRWETEQSRNCFKKCLKDILQTMVCLFP